MQTVRPAGVAPRPEIRATAPLPGRSLGGRIRSVFFSDFFVLYLSLAYFLLLVPFLPTLSTPGNISNLMSNMWPLLVVAVGQTFVLTIAGIDLSQGARRRAQQRSRRHASGDVGPRHGPLQRADLGEPPHRAGRLARRPRLGAYRSASSRCSPPPR